MLRPIALAAVLALAPLPALAAPVVEFAGYTWLVRSYGGGPGPNEWRESNVYVDADGLHLTIQQVDGVWTCAEAVMLGEPLGFGTYAFEVTGDLQGLDRNVVLGLFNYPGSAEVGPDGTNEIDIEFAQWSVRDNPNRLNWNIYPAVESGEKGSHAVPLELEGEKSSHFFDWSPTFIEYASFEGHSSIGKSTPIGFWRYAPEDAARDIPQVPLVVHMNLWLNEGKAPSDGKPAEIVIRDFRFTPDR